MSEGLHRNRTEYLLDSIRHGVEPKGENLIPQLQRPTIQPKHPIERYPCPKCGWYMIITRIEPDEPGYSARTFECSKCGNEAVLRATF